MENNDSPKDRVLIRQAIDITNLKITVEQLKDELRMAEHEIDRLTEILNDAKGNRQTIGEGDSNGKISKG